MKRSPHILHVLQKGLTISLCSKFSVFNDKCFGPTNFSLYPKIFPSFKRVQTSTLVHLYVFSIDVKNVHSVAFISFAKGLILTDHNPYQNVSLALVLFL